MLEKNIIVDSNLANSVEFPESFRELKMTVIKSALKNFFQKDDFVKFVARLQTFRKTAWNCQSCQKSIEGLSICCDMCLVWFHKKCAGLDDDYKSKKKWFCFQCS